MVTLDDCEPNDCIALDDCEPNDCIDGCGLCVRCRRKLCGWKKMSGFSEFLSLKMGFAENDGKSGYVVAD
jgi:hypothetical protein